MPASPTARELELEARGEPKPTVRVILDCSNTYGDQPGDGPDIIARRVAAESRLEAEKEEVS